MSAQLPVDRVPRAFVAIIASAMVTVCLSPASARDTEPAPAEILERAGTYVRQVEHTFITIICDERYEQHVGGRDANARSSKAPKPIVDRHMQSEMLFMWVLEQRTWLAVRNVLDVDGEPVPDSQDRLARALRGEARRGMSRLRQMLEESARFNIGPVPRNIGDPTLVLAFLDPDTQPRFAFSVAGHEHFDGAFVVKLAFEERMRPTIITDQGSDVVSRGFVWVRQEDGAIVRTSLEVTIQKPTPLKASVDVEFTADAKLRMMVPSRMNESYVLTHQVWEPVSPPRAMPWETWGVETPVNESVTGVATYANFRRFETSGRVIVPNE